MIKQMKPSAEELKRVVPGIDADFLEAHLSRLGGAYAQAFHPAEIGRHAAELSSLSQDDPVRVLVAQDGDGAVDCTVLAFDHRGLFTLITGAMAASGFSILSGRVFTYGPPPPYERGRVSRRTVRSTAEAAASAAMWRRRRIVDHFNGTLDSGLVCAEWAEEFRRRIGGLMSLLESGGPDGLLRARHVVDEMVASHLARTQPRRATGLQPFSVKVEKASDRFTTLRVVGRDTPAFLYALSGALSLAGVSIERVRIRTVRGMVEDELDVLDAHGRRIARRELRDRLVLSALLTKQFTQFLPHAPDPCAALSRFERMSEDILRLPRRKRWMELFSNPKALQDMASILGASDFLWEDLVRTQYESLLPVLGGERSGGRPSFTRGAIRARWAAASRGVSAMSARRAALNDFKDREVFRIDLDHILHASGDVRVLSERLTALAELVVGTATRDAWDSLVAAHGVPRAAGGIEARHAVFGLGKFGGAALGYASDIELLFVYSDSGTTDGGSPLDNAEFFGRLARETERAIFAKREGIFRVDLRLRPYGNSGPAACSLESFCRYYGPGGQAHSVERLALTRLRAVAGDARFGRRVARLRDEFVYRAGTISMEELLVARERQLQDKVREERYNAKFSPGALVDLEYCVQMLQVRYGGVNRALRTPRLHDALAALPRVGALGAGEARRLTDAYDFLRRLINGLRMLRGNALDLYFPPPGTDEHTHLARRMGYGWRGGLDPERQLRVDFETHTAVVRAFIEKHLGRNAVLPAAAHGSVADIVLAADMPHTDRDRILRKAGFRDAGLASRNLAALARYAGDSTEFARLAVLACDILAETADADSALNNWERFNASIADPASHQRLLLSQPSRLEMLLGVMGGSQFLADTLVRNPEFFEWATDPAVLRGPRDTARVASDIDGFVPREGGSSAAAWRDAVRRFRRRDILRIGTRDICLRVPVESVVADLSALADAIIASALRRAWDEVAVESGADSLVQVARRTFCVAALGKLGGRELNYSSDIDLLAVQDDSGGEAGQGAVRGLQARALEKLRSALATHTEEGYAYRVDLRLRPYGRSGDPVCPLSAFARYYQEDAAAWEVQALLKLRPVAGSARTGGRLVACTKTILCRPRDRRAVLSSIDAMRRKAAGDAGGSDVKSGPGGIRDVEFIVQGLQLAGLAGRPELLEANTVDALASLVRAGMLPGGTAAELRDHYLFLRRVEHYLQLREDRQVHRLPTDKSRLEALARSVSPASGGVGRFLQRLAQVRESVAAARANLLGAAQGSRH